MSDPETIALQRTLPDGQANTAISRPKRKKRVSSFWVKQLHTWHWMSSAICLIGMLLFAITGITLNHAGSIEATPQVQTVEKELPASLLDNMADIEGGDDVPLPDTLNDWAKTQL